MGPQNPKFSGALRAPEMLHFPKVFQAFGSQIPQNFSGALRAPETFIFLRFLKVSEPLFGVWCRPASSGRARAGQMLHSIRNCLNPYLAMALMHCTDFLDGHCSCSMFQEIINNSSRPQQSGNRKCGIIQFHCSCSQPITSVARWQGGNRN